MKSSLLLLLLLISLYGVEKPLYQASFNTNSTGIFLPIQLDGQECTFLFDTGASFVVLDKSFRHLMHKPLSLKEAEARTGIKFASKHIQTPNGEVNLEMFKAFSLRLGKLQVANRFPYLLADLKALWPFSGEKFCGILGISFIHQFRWEIDFDKGKIKAYVGAEPYMQDYSARTPIFWSKAHIPQVAVAFQGKEIAFDIDTGDNGSGRMKKENLLFLQQHSQILASQNQEVVTVSSMSISKEYRLKSLRFANVLYPKLVLQESAQNAIGLALLKRHNIVFDFPFNMLYLQHHKDYAAKQELDKSGLRIVLQDDKLIVYSKQPHKGATVRGIQKGDEILSVKGLENLNLYKMRSLVREEEGKEIFLQVKRQGKVYEAYIRLGKDPL